MTRAKWSPSTERGSESGMTLVEVLISVVILAMITGAISAAFVTGFRGVRPSQQRVRESNDAQVIAAFLVRDAQSAGGSDPATGSADPSLGVSSPGVAPDCTGPAGTAILRFAWREFTDSATSSAHVANYFFDASTHELVRNSCVDGAQDSQTELAGFVASIDPPLCIPASGPTAPCPTSPATIPDRVRVHITETNEENPSAPPYDYTLTASLRPQSQTPPAPGNSTPVPLLALGGCNMATPGVDVQESADVVVYGGVMINNTCNPLDVQGTSSFHATGEVIVPTTPAPDPYASLTPPPVDCVNGTHSGSSGPGTYTTAATFSNVTLASGIYIFCDGVTLDDAVTNVAGGGVLLYVAGGSLTSSDDAALDLAPPATGPYAGTRLVVWQAASNPTEMTLCCADGATANLGGTIYAPAASVHLENDDVRIRQIVASRVRFDGVASHSTIIGNKPTCDVSLDTPELPAWTVSRPYPNPQLAASCGSGGYRFTQTGLPPNLTLDVTTGIISGTPTMLGTFAVDVVVTDSIGERDRPPAPYTLRINPTPTIATATLPNWTIARDYPGTPVTVTAGTGTAPYTWSETGLPPGLTINTTNGTVTGTPSATGTFNPTIRVTDVAGATVTRSYAITINAAPQITGPATLPEWTVGQQYPNVTMTRADGTQPFTWSASGLPTGLTINPTTGVISGTPNAAGFYSVTVTVKDIAGAAASRAYSAKINPAPGIATASLRNGEQNRPYNFTLTPASGTPPYTWTATNLPAGLAIDLNSGTISGTPTGAGTFPNVTIRITDFTGAFADTTYTMVIALPVSISGPASLVNWTVNRDYPNTQITATNGVTPFTWSASGLPPGMTIDAGTGVISGTPAASGPFTIAVTVTSALGGVATRSYSITINNPPTITTASLPDGEQGRSYNTTVTAAQGTPPYAWAASGLPSGMAINATSGVISGTPTVAGRFGITITVTDAAGASMSQSLNLVLWPRPAITGTLPNGAVGVAYSGTLTSTGGRPPMTWSATNMPAGLTMNAATGTLSGTPTVAGTRFVNVTVTDSLGGTATRSFRVTIGTAPVITTTSIPSWTVDRTYASFTMAGTGGTAPFTWSATGLPNGLTMDAAGVITGTPTTTGPFNATVTVLDNFGASNAQNYTIVINEDPAVTSSTLPVAFEGVAYSTTVSGIDGTAPYTWSATGLPAGLTISSSGIISGTPSVTGSFSVSVTLTDQTGATANRSLNLTIRTPLTLSKSPSPCEVQEGVFTTITVTRSGGTDPITWSASDLPFGGLAFDTATGEISGTPNMGSGQQDVTVTGTDVYGSTSTAAFTIQWRDDAPTPPC